MSPALPFTGERFTPECAGGIWYEHWHRYALASTWVVGKDVLDAACGEGYGSAFLASHARSVIGIDVSAEATAHAASRYMRENLRFQSASVTRLPLADASVDVVVSFETIEHLKDQEAMLAEFRRVLRPAGFLLLSAPIAPSIRQARIIATSSMCANMIVPSSMPCSHVIFPAVAGRDSV